MTATTPSQRNADITRRYQQGWTYQQIGDHYGLTRERVRQILVQQHGRAGLELLRRQAQGSRQRQLPQTIAEQLRPLWEAGVRETPELARRSGLSTWKVRLGLQQLVGADVLREQRRQEARQRQRMDRQTARQQAVQDIRVVAAGLGLQPGASLTRTAYDQARGSQQLSGQVIAIRWRYWRRAVEAAGFRCGQQAARPPRFSDGELLRALDAVTLQLGREPSMQEYQQHSQARPTAAVLRRRWGSWGRLIEGYREWLSRGRT